jgi:2-desacetyl-2-hydroxyethyl bacteriochlorophyllide A dehydrogenase
LGIESEGSFQKNWVVDAGILHKIPDELSYRLAALAEPLAVCCHAVKRARISSGEKAVVIGGGPIGIMTALVLKSKNNDVVISEVDEKRMKNCEELGLKTVNPAKEDLPGKIREWTQGRGVTAVFEASGSQAGLDVAHELLHPNGRLVTVATYGKPMSLDIRELHFKQITLVTTRAYQRDDFEEALSLLKRKQLPAEQLITKIVPLSGLKDYLATAVKGISGIKVLVDCQN